MKFVKPIFAILMCSAPIPAFAASLFVNTNFSQSTGPGQTYSYRSPTYPYSAIGVNMEVGYNAIEATASFNGRARFDMPTLQAGDLVFGGRSIGRMNFSHAFTSTQLTGGVNFFGGVNYHVGYGPLSSDGRIFRADLPVTIDQQMANGSAVGGSIAQQSVSADGPFVGYRFRAEVDYGIDTVKVGEAALGVTPGLRASNTLNWNSDFEYGYYSWANSTGGLNATDTLVWRAAAPGSSATDLILTNFVGAQYYNVMPGVRMNGVLQQNQLLEFTLSGQAFLEALGRTLINESFNTSVPLAKDGQGFESIGNEWISRNVWSTAVDCGPVGIAAGPCRSLGEGFDLIRLQDRVGDSFGDLYEIPDDPGGFGRVPGFTDKPDPGPFCVGNSCYRLDDPDFPVTRIVLVSGAVPEPATWAMMILGFGLVGSAARRRGPKAVPA